MKSNIKFYKLKLIKEFNEECEKSRQTLLDEMITYATDPIVYTRRMRMIQQLTEYQAQILKKIQNFETDDITDFENITRRWRHDYPCEIFFIVDRSS